MTRDVAKWVEYVPIVHEPLGSVPRPSYTECGCYTGEVEAGGSEVQHHLSLHSKFEASLDCVRPCLKQYAIYESTCILGTEFRDVRSDLIPGLSA